MERMFAESLALLVRGSVLIVAILACSCAAPAGGERQKQSRHEFRAVLIDTATQRPAPSVRVVLARKKDEKLECTIDTSLTSVSKDGGEILIPNVEPGEYVVFYSLSASLNPGLKGKVVNYDPEAGRSSSGPANFTALRLSLGRLMAPQGAVIGSDSHGRLVLKDGYIYSLDFDLATIVLSEGEPGAGNVAVIGISTDFPPTGPKSGQ